jgi:ADP-ribosylglycohydrolase
VGGIDRQRALGALLGSAVGDALGAPFEFGPAARYTARFPPGHPHGNEMIGGGGFGWGVGEFTDDTQMAIVLGEHLRRTGGLDEPALFADWQRWAGEATDVGVQTRAVLHGGDWEHGARLHYERTGRGAGNGALMRATTSALFAATFTKGDSMRLACRQAVLTHGDPAAWWGAAIYHVLVRAGVRGRDPFDDLDDALDRVPPEVAAPYRDLLTDDAAPHSGNGAVWGCLADAARAVRDAVSFEDAMRRACDVGDDVDTVACVAGGIAGSRWGVDAIPDRWLEVVYGRVLGRTYRADDLAELADRLVGDTAGGPGQ